MKKTLFAFLMFALCVCSSNATDYLSVSKLVESTTNPGEYSFTVSLSGSNCYTGYQVEIVLPQSIELVLTSKGKPSVTASKTLWPYEYDEEEEMNVYSHTLSSSYNNDTRKLKISCISMYNEDFTKTSGKLFTVKVTLNPLSAYSSPQVAIENSKMIFASKDDGSTIIEPFSETIITDTWPASCALNVSQANQYSTCILPFSAPIPTGLKAFSARGTEDGAVVLEEVSEFAAYIPYILYAAQGYSGTVSGTVDPANYVDSATDGLLVGAIQPLDATSGYVMQNQGQGVKFYQIKQGDHYTINSGKCYLNIPESHSPMFDLDASLTSVTSAQTAETESCEYRDLQGRPIAEPVVGQMYIKGGKTYLKVK